MTDKEGLVEALREEGFDIKIGKFKVEGGGLPDDVRVVAESEYPDELATVIENAFSEEGVVRNPPQSSDTERTEDSPVGYAAPGCEVNDGLTVCPVCRDEHTTSEMKMTLDEVVSNGNGAVIHIKRKYVCSEDCARDFFEEGDYYE